MKQNYFVHNGRRYNTGEYISFCFFDYRARKSYETRVKFLYYNTSTKEYFIEIYGQEYSYTEDVFYKNIHNAAKPRAPSKEVERRHTLVDELNIDGLLIAWMWYLFIMAIGTIFYDRIGIWALASIIFFDYRNRKLKEAGYK